MKNKFNQYLSIYSVLQMAQKEKLQLEEVCNTQENTSSD